MYPITTHWTPLKMKMTITNQRVTSVNTGAEHTAKIKASPRAFHILSGALYSDKILAVVRELCCNASDAHVAAKNEQTPFELKLPSNWDNTFYVKDFGTGISEENIYEMYMTYFESTKTDSNDFIGQLGLGSKSPFSYGATFTVESRQNGIKKTYTCYKNAELMPAVTLMDTAITDEPNGLTVALAVKPDDVRKFVDSAKFALMYVQVQPKVIGVTNFEVYPVHYERELGNCKQRARNSIYNGPRVVQGSVSYPVDLDIVKEMLQSKKDVSMLEYFKYMNIDVIVGIGDVEVAPSREALSYDLRTSVAIYDILLEASVQFYDAVQTEINNCDNLWNANLLFNHIRNNYVTGDSYRSKNLIDVYEKKHGKFTYNGAELGVYVKIGGKDSVWTPKQIKVCTSYGSFRTDNRLESGTSYAFNDGVSISIQASSDYIVVLDDVHNIRVRRKALGAYLSRHITQPHGHWKAVIIQPNVEKGPLDQKEVNKFVKLLGGPPVVKLSDLPVPANVATASKYKAKAKDELMMFVGQCDTNYGSRPMFGRKSWKTVQVDLMEGGFYLDVDRYDVVTEGFNRNVLDDIIKTSKALGLLDDAANIFGANEKKKAVLMSAGGKPWVNLIDHLQKMLSVAVVNNDVSRLFNAKQYVQAMDHEFADIKYLLDNWRPEYDIINNNGLKAWREEYQAAVHLKNTGVSSSAYSELCSSLRVALPVETWADVAAKIGIHQTTTNKNCPMLNFIKMESAVDSPDATQLLVTTLSI